MIPEDPDLLTKLATLRTMQAAGNSPRVAELLLIEWPSPDGAIFYGTRLAADLLDNAALLARIDPAPIELRLGSGVFLDILNTAGISDDRIDLDLWDGDDEMTRLTAVHGSGMRVEAFYYFPDVDLLVSEWWGHWQPPDKVSIDRFKGSAESGFRSSNLPLPSRAFFSGCQAVFGGLLSTQAEIDEGDCPYNIHLGGPAAGSDPDWTNLTNVTPDTGGELIKTGGSSGWDAGASHDVAVASGDEALMRVTVLDGFTTFGFFTTDSPVSGNQDCHFCLQFNPTDNSVSVKHNGTLVRANAATWAPGNSFEVALRNGVFKMYKGGTEIVLANFTPPAPVYPLYLGVAIFYVGAGVSASKVEIGNIGSAPGFGLEDPATSQPYTSCPRNNKAACIARLGDDRSFLAFDTIINSHVVHQTKGPNITVTSRGNETNLRRPLRVIAGRRHVSDLDLLTFVVEPNTNHPDQGSVKCLFAVCEGSVQSVANGKINGATIAPQHSNYRTGEKRQGQTSFSPQIPNYSGTGLFLGVAQGNFNGASADDLRGEADVDGSKDVRVYSDATTFAEQYTSERGWWLLHCMRTKRWGHGLDARRIYIPDFLDIAVWFKEIVSVTDKDGNVLTGPRSQFNAELIDRTAQQQINDICLSGRLGLPFPDKGKLRVIPLRKASELFSASVFTDKAFFGALDRAPTSLERTDWIDALLAARDISAAALLLECQDRMLDMFNSVEYLALSTTDEEFITDCYQSFLRREPDPAGFVFWLDQLALTDRDNILNAFKIAGEFVDECTDREVPLFTDRGEERNICWENSKTTLTHSIQSDADLPNRIVINFDDATKQNKQIPLTFEDVPQQLRAGVAFGDTTRRTVEREYVAFGITDAGEAARLGNLLLDLGEFDEGGLKNNLRVTFTSWYLYAVSLHKYQVIRVASNKLDVLNTVRVSQGLEPFGYFRIRSIRRLPDLKVEISAQAYPVEYYERLELLTQGPDIPPSGEPAPDPGNPDNPGPTEREPFDIDLIDVTHNDDQILFRVGTEPVIL